MEIFDKHISKLESLSEGAEIIDSSVLDKKKKKKDISLTSNDIVNNAINFTGSAETQRYLASSKLQAELKSCGIYVSGAIYSDKLWGGLDSYSGRMIHDKINDARNADRITDSQYQKLISMLKQACHYQS